MPRPDPRITVTGSIATDHLMRFPGRFAEQLLAGKLAQVSLSFLVDDLTVRRGGVAANIAYGLAQLGLRPALVGAVGPDFADYRSWLEGHGVDCGPVLVSATAYTARFVCTTDADLCQIASFYPGAMAEAAAIDLGAIAGSPPDLVLIGPDDPAAMHRHATTCRRLGVPFAADPSQQLATMSGPEIAAFVAGARFLITNEYEYDLLRAKTGVSEAGLDAMTGVVVTTLGAGGVRLRDSTGTRHIAAVPVAEVADPTGGGDAFRAGFAAGAAAGLPLEVAAALGCLLGAYAVAAHGTQEYTVRPDRLLADLTTHYGPAVAETVRGTVTGHRRNGIAPSARRTAAVHRP